MKLNYVLNILIIWNFLSVYSSLASYSLTCDSTCLTCFGEKNTECLSCPLGKSLFQFTCVSMCPVGFWSNNNQCYPCDYSCYSCNGPTSKDCKACNAGTTLASYPSGECLKSCPLEGRFLNTSTSICDQCHNSCRTCKGQRINDCTSCYDLSYLYNGECLANCPNNYYRNTANNQCSNCHSKCAICKGSTASDCLRCNNGSFLYKNKCLPDCPTGFFPNADGNICSVCSSSCGSCNGPLPTNCTSCNLNKYFVSVNNSCNTYCPKGYYKSSNTNACLNCPTGCAKCEISSNVLKCTECFNSFNNTNSNDQNNCQTSCDSGFFPNTTSWKCEPCTQNCAKCLNQSDNACITCQTGYLLFQGKCIQPPCPDIGYFLDTTTKSCKPCHSSCFKCFLEGSSYCIACNQTKKLAEGSKCVESCPYKSVYIPVKYLCQAEPSCSSSCLSCYNVPSNCTACKKGYFLYQTSCLEKCPTKTYPVFTTNLYHGTCKSCHSACQTCIGPASNDCTSCLSPYMLSDALIGSCIKECYGSTYYDVTFHDCKFCHPSCKTCNGWRSENCYECQPDFTFFPVDNDTETGFCKIISVKTRDFTYYSNSIGITPVNDHKGSVAVALFVILWILLICITVRLDKKIRRYNRIDYINHILAHMKVVISQENKKDEYKAVHATCLDDDQIQLDKPSFIKLDDSLSTQFNQEKLFMDIDNQKNDEEQEQEYQRQETILKNRMKYKHFWDLYFHDLGLHHSLFNLFAFQSPFSPSYVRANIFIMKMIIECMILEIILFNSMEYAKHYFWCLLAMFIANITNYIISHLLKVSNDDIVEYLNCPSSEWKEYHVAIHSEKIMHYLIFYVFLFVLALINCYFHLLWEQYIGSDNYNALANMILLTIFFDLVVFGLTPGFITTKFIHDNYIKHKWFALIEEIITNARAYRTMRYYILKDKKKSKSDV